MRTFVYFFLVVVLLSGVTSCVSKKVYDELNDKYNRLLDSQSELVENNDRLLAQRKELSAEITMLKDSVRLMQNKKESLQQEYTAVKQRLDELIASYEALQTESAGKLAEQGKEISRLLNELQDREDQLAMERLRLEKLNGELSDRSRRIDELEQLINERDAQMEALRQAVTGALKAFEGKGLHITRKNGKLYVSMENKLLFASGSWQVESRGLSALQKLAPVLVKNPGIEVLIEGHTDNVPYRHGVLIDNWDLSVKRATSIVRILQAAGVSPGQITAAGRGEYLPVSDNTTSSGRAANRRIEIILSPNLDQINRLLNGE